MSWRLQNRKGQGFPLRGPVVLGRSRSADVCLDDHLASRRHAQLHPEGNGVWIRDLSSRNGTYVNGVRLTSPQRMGHGDRLTIGNTHIVLERTPDPYPQPIYEGSRSDADLRSIPAKIPGREYQGIGQSYNPNTAFLIELVGGFFGLLGLGYIYAGQTSDGVLRLIGWLVYDLVAALVISFLLALIVGIVCIPIQLVIQVAVPLWSANTLKNRLLDELTF